MKRKGHKMQAAVIPIMQVDNPAEYAERVVHPKVTVQRALRDDPLGNMHQRRQVSESQYAAGRQFQAAAETISIGHVRSIDTTQEPVDGSPPVRMIVTSRYRSAMDLRTRWRDAVGRPGFLLLETILIDKLTQREAAQRIYRNTSKATITYVGHRFRECLDEVARSLGLAG